MERNLDFDTVLKRRGTDSLKFDFAARRGMPEDVLPMWVADMDFRTSSYVEDALIERARHGIFGYSDLAERGSGYFLVLQAWMKTHHQFEVQEEWLVKTPGVVNALAMAVRAFSEEGDAVLIQQPVYYPFSEVIRDNGRRVVSSDLVQDSEGRYHIDFDDFEQKITQNQIRLFLLCSPHNPVSRVWTREELTRLGELCQKHGVLVVSDEIHADFVFEGEHIPFASLGPAFAAGSVTCTSASKTFNLATMLLSNIFIPDARLRRRFRKQLDGAGISQLSALALAAYEAAYKDGGEWYAAMHRYVRANICYLRDYVAEYLPQIKVTPTEGTYLPWMDFRGTGLSHEEIDRKVMNEAKLWLDSGSIFGKPGEGFQRINVACPRATLEEALGRLRQAF